MKEISMISITRSIKIEAPIYDVIDCMGRPGRLETVHSNAAKMQDIQQPTSARDVPYDWRSKMPGMRLDGRSDPADHVLYGQLVTRSEKGPNSAITWSFAADGSATYVTLRIGYEIPPCLLNTGKQRDFVQDCEHDADAILQNMKVRVEVETARGDRV